MTVTLTSPVFGLNVDDPYTGPEEAWLLAQGYAKQAGYTGPGVSNTGATDVVPANDPTLASNRELPPSGVDHEHPGNGLPDPGRLDPAISEGAGGTAEAVYPAYDFDAGGVQNDAPSDFVVEPNSGAAGATHAVTIYGQNFEGVTGVTFGGTAATSVVVEDDETITCVAPSKTAGAVAVVVTNPTGSKTEAGAFTYA